MISIDTLTAHDYDNWDNYVSRKNSPPYLRTAYKRAIEEGYGHACYYLLAKTDNTVCGVLPLVHITQPLGSGQLCSLPFCDVGGIIADSQEIYTALKTKALSLKNTLGIKHIVIREAQIKVSNETKEGIIKNDDEKESPDLTGQKVRMLLDLPTTSDELLRSFKSKLRSQIKKAEKNGLTVSLSNNKQHMDDFYQVFSINMHALGSPVHAREWFEAIRKHYGEKLIISVVKKDQDIAGAGIVLLNGHSASIPWASTNAAYNRLAPNMLLYWSLLEFVTDQHCLEFDFGRSTYGEGTYKFKKQWGAKPQLLHWHNFSDKQSNTHSNSQIQKLSTNLSKPSKKRQIIENIWRVLPLALVNFIGPKVRKYISL